MSQILKSGKDCVEKDEVDWRRWSVEVGDGGGQGYKSRSIDRNVCESKAKERVGGKAEQ